MEKKLHSVFISMQINHEVFVSLSCIHGGNVTHTAVILNCWNERLDEVTIENKPSEFGKIYKKVEKYRKNGLENAYGYGRSLAVWLIENGQTVKDVNTALSLSAQEYANV